MKRFAAFALMLALFATPIVAVADVQNPVDTTSQELATEAGND